MKKIIYGVVSRIRNNSLLYLLRIRYDIGKNKAKYYIIKRDVPGAGIFSNYITYISHINFAINNGLIPVIDMMSYYSIIYHENKKDVGVKNVWEDYFVQPCGVSLDDALNSSHVYSKGDFAGSYYVSHKNSFDQNRLNNWRDISKKYLMFNDKTSSHLIKISDSFELNKKRTIGVSFRSGYDILCSKGHERQIPIGNIIDKVDELRKTWSCQNVFVAVESQYVVDEFKDYFGDDLLYLERPRVGDDTERFDNDPSYLKEFLSSLKSAQVKDLGKLDGVIDVARFNRENDKYNKGLEYITEMYLLSQCNCMIATKTSGSLAALVLSEKEYENYIFLDGESF